MPSSVPRTLATFVIATTWCTPSTRARRSATRAMRDRTSCVNTSSAASATTMVSSLPNALRT